MLGSALTMRPARAMVMLAMLMTGCASTGTSETESACDAMRPYLPTWSSQDTEQSKNEGARFLDVFKAVCND